MTFAGGAVPTPLPNCAWCSAANTLTVEWAESGVEFCVCSCCSHRTRVVDGLAYKSGARRDIAPEPMVDVSGTVIDGP